MAIDSKRIAKNTIFLYARLILVFMVSLYTSRVVLDKLGVDDYALYNVVFSVIGLLSFLNGTLSSGTSRFITFDLGKGDTEKLKTTFSTALSSHVLLSIIILLLGETLGVWYVCNVMECPPERFQSAFIVYQISIVVAMISIIQVPFTSEIMAHEKMDFYAYIGIYEAVAKLLIVFLLSRAGIDKLILYASLVCVVQITVCLFNLLYSKSKFIEVQFRRRFDKSTFKSILSFSGWNIIANLSNILMSQGVVLLFNVFFLPVVVAAQSIANQISSALMQFVNNVRQAVNPQVVKLYADNKFEESKKLTLVSAEYVYYLLLLLGVPAIMVMPQLLNLWLVEVPEYTVIFARLIIVGDILGNFSAAFMTPMSAANKIQKNSYAALILSSTQFALLYVLFRNGLGPVWARIIGLVFTSIWSFVVKPYILWKDVDYKFSEMFHCIGKCMFVSIFILIACVPVYFFISQDSIINSLIVALLSALIVVTVVFICMNKSHRTMALNFVSKRLKNDSP